MTFVKLAVPNTNFKLLHSWQRELDNGGFVSIILMGLSKAYDCISHELLIARLECYALDEISLKLILNCLSQFPDTSPTDISPMDSSPTDTPPTDISPTRNIPEGHFPDQTHSRRTFPRPHTSPTNQMPDGHFPGQAHPRRTLSRPDKCPTDRYFPD